jgi:hypothetical protein
MSTVSMPPLVNDQGNINVHIKEGAYIPMTVQDDNGVLVDATPLTLVFRVGAFSKTLEQDPDNLIGKVLELTTTDLAGIMHGANFIVADETDPDRPVNKWEGRIYKRG